MFRYRLCRFVLLSLVASATVALPEQAAAQDADEQILSFVGGGWGHGVGMSQYGALGRAEAGHTAEEILTYYYDGATVEDRQATIDEFVGDGVRVKLVNKLTFNSGEVRDDILVTVDTARSTSPGPLTVTIGDQVIEVGPKLRLEQGGRVEGTDTWRWILDVDGVDICTGCVARAPEVSWPDGTVVGIGVNYGAGSDSQYEYGEHDRGVLVFDSGTGSDSQGQVILRIGLTDYLGALAEMPGHWHPQAVRAQAIAGRSYALHRAIDREANTFDVFDSVQDQVYGGFDERQDGRVAAAADGAGLVVAFDEEIVQTFYSSSNGGHSESTENSSSFGGAQPYHIAKPDPFDAAPDDDGEPQNPHHRRQFNFTVSQVSEWLAEYSSADLDVGTVRQVFVEDLPPSGRITNALVTVVGSDRTIEVRGFNGVFATPDDAGYEDLPPFGLRFQAAIQRGCQRDFPTSQWAAQCPRSSNFSPIGFADVPADEFFYEPVNWMVAEEITKGTSPGQFSPWSPVDRAQAGTFIWRFMGEPAPLEPSGFDDVPDGVFYTDSVAWMKEQQITLGTSDTEFSPGQLVTRAQLATFLYRLAGEPVVEVNNQFDDVPDADFFTDAVAWMVKHEITSGFTPTTFEPHRVVTRGQAATFLWRLAGTPAAFADGVELPEKMRS
ncbi:MAG: SpoIID/LytB domain-containing protein [Actinomycetota bacterium]